MLNRKGSATTIEIIDILMENALNIHQISKAIGKDYHTVKYHIQILLDYELIVEISKGYGALYQASELLIKNRRKYIYEKRQFINNCGEKNERLSTRT